jgi:tetratricopeptide (TPR) repeat protein
MSASDSHLAAGTSRYPRSAHATIRGYLYQTCLGVLRWLDLQPNEILLCEGDEDLDRFLLGGESFSEQVKAYSGNLGLSDQTVLDSLRSFLQSYVALRRRGETRTFIFTTTAQPSRQRKPGLDPDILERWRNHNLTPADIASIRAQLEPKADERNRKGIEGSISWLDDQEDGWKSFTNSVEWSFDAPDLDAIRRTIRDRLATREDTRLLPAETFLEWMVVRVLDASIQKDPRERTLTQKDLSDLLETTRNDLGTWAASSRADRIRTVFDEVGQIHRLLVDGISPLPENPTPGKLLTAAYEVIPFDEPGRREELDLLASWCDSEPRRSVLLVTGEGGSGKSRLMIEWCRRLRHQGWHAGFLRRDRDERDLDPLLEGSAPRLVVVDYAETRIEVVQPLVLKAALASQGEGPKLRIVLLARRQADWWDNLSRQDHEVEHLLGSSPSPRGITPLIPRDLEERRQAFRVAVEGFARQLHQGIPAGLRDPDLSGRNFDRALYLHMAALAALQGKRIETAEAALKEILDHERRFWNRLVEDEVSDRSLARVFQEAITSSVAALTLIRGAADQQQAKTLLDRVLRSFPLQPHHPGTILRMLRGLYGADGQGERYLEPLQPDLLGEQLVAETLTRNSDLLGRVLDGGSDAEATATLTVLTRLAQRQSELGRWLKAAFQGRLERLAELALEVAVETGDPIGMILAEELKGEVPVEVVLRLENLCNDERYLHSVPLMEVAHIATERALASLQNQDSRDEEKQLEKSRLLFYLGIRLRALGHLEPALDATQKAVEIYRKFASRRPEMWSHFAGGHIYVGILHQELGRPEQALVATQDALSIFRHFAELAPDIFQPALASALQNMGIWLNDLGRRDQALTAIQEGVEIRRKLAETKPDAFRSDLASSLQSLGSILLSLGRLDQALDATRESVEITRELAALRPDIYKSELASCLTNLGIMLQVIGHDDQALEPAQEAVEIRRELAELRPDAFQNVLAKSLNNIAPLLSKLGRQEQALSTIREAIGIRRQLAETQPKAFQPALAINLNALDFILGEIKGHEGPLDAARERVEIYRHLAKIHPDVFLPDLASSLNLLGLQLKILDSEKALAATREALDIHRELAQAHPDAFLPELALSLNNVSNRLSEIGRREEALAAAREAVKAFRQSTQIRPDVYAPALAQSLMNLGASLSDFGLYKEAIVNTQEAIKIQRKLAETQPGALPDLAVSLNNLVTMLSALGRQEKAFSIREEAIRILTPSFLRLPTDFAPWMAMMVQDYLARAETAGKEPDADLLTPILEILESLSTSEEAPNPGLTPPG